MTSEGIGLRSRQVPPREDVYLPLGAIVEEDSEVEELVPERSVCAPSSTLSSKTQFSLVN